MSGKFIYVFDEDVRDMLLAMHFMLLKSDAKNNVYVFENNPAEKFMFDNVTYLLSNTLTF